ncbi:CRP/FNR family transcriptional regulator [Clostridium saccharoperbutylacetonicum]|uniref:Putative transcriptional regulator, Crp/Fnr family n=1 Tax=Clostridium saccharoperbutylacetonicum N1-4(HMT) TaxID=931276 RepID=M1LXK8_9CLOT|nr:Crp/Fnr family transcriptional regulator [Clostridium saccharoperbutylacetonicum]AGF58005.1 putative transcriptional regulator, Crp/Fnr family [Clostridium saccharoperbutylacetonicum N1-4(HMT)]NRT61222.1 CRP/FNR family transcriptional regulator [Clostridium saccharoperbutylacetonicum]NSB24539.1 CRP/FNR family transcriptional regulator [Clostridium saccharoperbutylacetonicum]NSB43914.1 CRP/FNR family transcriptional regulator [Clostridium saccharoperbutylacetonicum]
MVNKENTMKNRIKDLNALYEVYPVLKKVNESNNQIINELAVFKTVYSDEFVAGADEACNGILFVIKGTVKIQKINEDGEETNLYNIKQGEFCHEALSCLANFESLNITGKAIQDSKVCIIPFDVVRKYLIEDKEFLLYMYRDLYYKFNTVIGNKEEMIHESLETRLIKLLMSKKSNIIYGTHNELAFEIDSVREVVSRKLKNIEKLGYIKLERGKISILRDLTELLEKN